MENLPIIDKYKAKVNSLMIIFSSIAYAEKYRHLSLRTIETFNKYCKNSKLNIITENIDFYSPYLNDNVTVTRGVHCDGIFKANLKFQGIKESLKFASHGDFIVIIDADCYFTENFKDECFRTLNYGLTVQLNNITPITPMEVQNRVISQKILTLNPDEHQLYYSFREACLIFKVNDDLIKMAEEWENICNTIDDLGLNHAAETFDIQVAAIRQKYPINSLGQSPIIDMIHMTDENGGIGSPLA